MGLLHQWACIASFIASAHIASETDASQASSCDCDCDICARVSALNEVLLSRIRVLETSFVELRAAMNSQLRKTGAERDTPIAVADGAVQTVAWRFPAGAPTPRVRPSLSREMRSIRRRGMVPQGPAGQCTEAESLAVELLTANASFDVRVVSPLPLVSRDYEYSFRCHSPDWQTANSLVQCGSISGEYDVIEVVDAGAWSHAYQEIPIAPGAVYNVSVDLYAQQEGICDPSVPVTWCSPSLVVCPGTYNRLFYLSNDCLLGLTPSRTGIWEHLYGKFTASVSIVTVYLPQESTFSSFARRLRVQEVIVIEGRAHIMSAVRAVSPKCRHCILSTVASVCGERCIQDRLHLTTAVDLAGVPSIRAHECLPKLANKLAAAEMARFLDAVKRREPFGLEVAASKTAPYFARDLFLATNETIYGQPTYRGIDTHFHIFACDDTETWVVASPSVQGCRNGEVRMSVLSGEARVGITHDGSEDGTARIFLSFHFEFSRCSEVLQSSGPDVSDGRLEFESGMPADHVSCWLSRFLGPQVANGAALTVRLPANAHYWLLTDLVARHGPVDFIGMSTSTLHIGDRQLRVFTRLRLDGIILAGSTHSSAVYIEGAEAFMTNSTVRDCSARTNLLDGENRLQSLGGGFFLRNSALCIIDSQLKRNIAADGEYMSGGAAVFAEAGSHLKISGSRLVENIAHSTGLYSQPEMFGSSQGGAIYANSSFITFETTELSRNSVSDGAYWVQGGALYATNSSVSIASSKVNWNRAERGGLLFYADDEEDSGSYGGAIQMENNSSLLVSDSEFADNVAQGGQQWAGPGAIGMYRNSSLTIIRSRLLRNVARGAGEGAYAGAVFGETDSVTLLRDSEFHNNSAHNGKRRAYAGAVYSLSTTLTILGCGFHGNRVSGSNLAQGGALFIDVASNVAINSSTLSENCADGNAEASVSQGGGIFIYPPATVTLFDCQLVCNQALNGVCGQESSGGAVYVYKGLATLDIEMSQLMHNEVAGGAAPGAGGALYTSPGTIVSVSHTVIVGSKVSGATAKGGAIFSFGTRLSLTNSNLTDNLVFSDSYEADAFGGGIYHQGEFLHLKQTCVLQNIAEIQYPAARASGGAFFVNIGARLIATGCAMQRNTARGTGLFDQPIPSYIAASHLGQFVEAAQAVYNSKASQVFSTGILELRESIIEDSNDVGDPNLHPARHFFVLAGGSALLQSCDFRGLVKGPRGVLVNIVSSTVEVLFRGCSSSNLDVAPFIGAKLAIVNSSFDPPVAPSALSIVPEQPQCSNEVAGESVCDRRATCRPAVTGIACRCEGEVRAKDGARDDGSECFRETRIATSLVSRTFSLKVRKPGISAEALMFNVRADGELTVIGACVTTMQLFPRGNLTGSEVVVVPWVINASAFGLRIVPVDGYQTAPSRMALDPAAGIFSTQHAFTFRIEVDCAETRNCPADSDRIETKIRFHGTENSIMQDEVLLSTEVEAVPSCSKSNASLIIANFPTIEMIDGFVLLYTKTPRLRAKVLVVDVDGLRILQFVPRIVLFWDKPWDKTFSHGIELLLTRDVASLTNEFYVDVPADERDLPGVYNLTLVIYSSWNGTGEADCQIMKRSVMVVCEAGFVLEGSSCVASSNSQLILGLALGAMFVAMVTALASILYWSWRRDPERARRLLRWIIQAELRLVMEGLVQLWDACSDNLTFFLVVQPSNSMLVAPYTCMICVTNVVSFGVIALKIRWLVWKCIGRTKERPARSSQRVTGLSDGLVSQRVLDLAEKLDRQREALQEQQDAHVIEKEGIYAELALGLFEDIPFIVLNM